MYQSPCLFNLSGSYVLHRYSKSHFFQRILGFLLHSFIMADLNPPVITCGYADGKIQEPRTAAFGYGCRVDTANGLWGFCPTTVISARDCGLAGLCVDAYACTSGCGRLTSRRDITTFSWYVRPHNGTWSLNWEPAVMLHSSAPLYYWSMDLINHLSTLLVELKLGPIDFSRSQTSWMHRRHRLQARQAA